jgi:hypothetical protein
MPIGKLVPKIPRLSYLKAIGWPLKPYNFQVLRCKLMPVPISCVGTISQQLTVACKGIYRSSGPGEKN